MKRKKPTISAALLDELEKRQASTRARLKTWADLNGVGVGQVIFALSDPRHRAREREVINIIQEARR